MSTSRPALLPSLLAATVLAAMPAVRAEEAPASPAATPAAATAAAPAPGFDLAATPPHDPAVLTGTLANGMRWYVMRNEKPEKRVEMRLAVKVGSVQETEEERGLAHFNEHMNFNGTENFESGELIEYLESIGSRFGADSNAYTSYDETVYMLQVPTDKDGAVEKGLQILADWAGRAKLEATEIDKERGVVLDELRRGKGAGKRIREKQDQVLFQGSRYADRRTIGLEKVISGASHDVVRGFYRRWYRPDVMAVVVVGDVDASAMAARVREIFGALPAPKEPTVIAEWPVPAHAETLYSVESDKELTSSSVSITYKHDDRPTRTIGDLRADTVDGVAGYLLTLRLRERTEKPDPPFLSAGAGVGGSVKTLDVFRLWAQAKDGEIPEAAAALMEELERARAHGFLPAELDRVKTQMLAFSERAYKESRERRSGERIGGIVGSFLEDQTYTSDEFDFELAKAVLPGIGLDEVNAALRRWTEPASRVVLVQAPAKEGAVPTVEQVRAAVEPAQPREVAAYVDDLAGKSLMETPPEGGKVTGRRTIAELGTEVVTLSNGATLVVKPTDFRADQVLFNGFARGGAAGYGPDRYVHAIRADTYANESGLAGYTSTQLQKLLAGSGKIAGASPSIGRFTRNVGGSARPQDLETMLQMVHLAFVQPAFRPEAFQRMVDQEVEYLRNQLNSPGGVYGLALDEVSTNAHWLWRTPAVAEIQALDAARLEALYREMFDDASEWTFFFVGNVDLERDLPLMARYLGGLPTTSATPRPGDARHADLDIRTAPAGTRREVVKGVEDQSRTALMIPGRWDLDPQVEFEIDAVLDLLEIRLREVLREEKGETYGVSAGFSTFAPYERYGRLNVSFTSSPDARADMVADVREGMKALRTTSASAADVAKLKELRLNALEESEKENGYWLGSLHWNMLLGRDPRIVLEQRKRIAGLDARRIRAAARKWMDPEDIIEVYLVPETWKPAAAAAAAAAPAAAGEPAPAAAPAAGGEVTTSPGRASRGRR